MSQLSPTVADVPDFPSLAEVELVLVATWAESSSGAQSSDPQPSASAELVILSCLGRILAAVLSLLESFVDFLNVAGELLDFLVV